MMHFADGFMPVVLVRSESDPESVRDASDALLFRPGFCILMQSAQSATFKLSPEERWGVEEKRCDEGSSSPSLPQPATASREEDTVAS